MQLMLMLAAAAETSGGHKTGFWAAYTTNPLFLTMNMVVSAIVIAVIAERFFYQFTKYRVNTREFFSQVKKLVMANNIDRAIKMCEARDYPILQLVKAGLTHANKSEDEIDAALSEKYADLKPAIEQRIGSLWSLANIATLIGLLGTVYGLIHTFGAVSAAGLSQADKQSLLAAGIAEAMFNTAFGLGVAVTCMIAHLILNIRAKRLAHELETTMERVFNLLVLTKSSGR